MKSGQHGFGHLALLAAIVVVIGVGIVGWRVMAAPSKDGRTAAKTQNVMSDAASKSVAQNTEPDIELQNVGVTLNDDILFTTQATTEFKSKGLKGFYVFGDALSGGRQNPNFEFAALKEGTRVISAINGIVGFIKEQTDSNDYEVLIQPKEGSQWTVGYDHLIDVTVKRGDAVKAGDPLGQPARQNNGMLRFEIQVNKDTNGQTAHICPSTLLAPKVKDTILANLASMQNNWEQTTGFELYDLTAQRPIGCLKTTLTPAEAEGR